MAKKKRRNIRKSKQNSIIIVRRFIFYAFLIVVLGALFSKFATPIISNTAQVLGISFLAKSGDDDSSGSGSGGGGDSGNSGSLGSGSEGSRVDDDSDSKSSGSRSSGSSGGTGGSTFTTSSGQNVTDGTRVECVGPDGKTFQTSFGSCEDLNEAWGNANFQFKIISGGTNSTGTQIQTRSFSADDIDEDENEEENEAGAVETAEVEDEEEGETGVRITSEPERTEIRLSEEERIRVRTKDGRTRIDITSGGIKTRLEYRDDRVVVKAELEDGTEAELEEDTIFKIDDRLDASGIKIATAGAEKFIVQRGGAGAVTEFPLSIDLATNTLLINTPAGQRQVTVLPDQAVQNLIAANVISQLVSNNSLVASDITSVGSVIALGEKNGVPIYQILGISNQRLLGFIPVVIEKTVTLSAETGEIESTQIPIFDRVLDIVSF